MIARAARLLVMVAALIGSLVFFGPAAHACSCARADTATHVEWADQVFTGTVTSSRATGGQGGQVVFDVQVERAFKGEVAASMRVVTAASSAACGIGGLPVGSRYVFFTTSEGVDGRAHAGDVEGAVHTGLCSGSTTVTPLLVKQVEAVTGAGTSPLAGAPVEGPVGAQSNTGGSVWPFVTALVALALAAGTWTARRTT